MSAEQFKNFLPEKWRSFDHQTALKYLSLVKKTLLKKPRVESFLGIDLSSNVVKLLQINSSKGVKEVENFAIAALPSTAIVKEEIKEPSLIVNTLKQLVKQSGIKTRSVALAIPRSQAIIKNITIDSRLNTHEIEARAWLEAQRLFPDLVQDIYLDFNVIGPSLQDPSQLDMVLVACRKEHIQPYLELLQQSGLHAMMVDVNCYALERALVHAIAGEETLETVALLNLNFGLSSLIVLNQNQMIYAHDHGFDGARLMQQARKYAGEEEASLVQAFQQSCSINDAAFAEILKENLSAHLRHSIHFFYSSRPNITIQKIILAGDCAMIPDLSAFIYRETHIETQVANPFQGMQLGASVDQKNLEGVAASFMLSCGLALSILE